MNIADAQMHHLKAMDKDEFNKPAHNMACPNLRTESYICNKLEQLNKEVEVENNALDSILKKQHQMKVQLNKDHPSILGRMPLEIINSVFDSFVNGVSPDLEELEKTANPLPLGAVCQSWRRIA